MFTDVFGTVQGDWSDFQSGQPPIGSSHGTILGHTSQPAGYNTGKSTHLTVNVLYTVHVCHYVHVCACIIMMHAHTSSTHTHTHTHICTIMSANHFVFQDLPSFNSSSLQWVSMSLSTSPGRI